jgi:UDP-GlcNAc:undecaprenyl-phosphate GlcNAc-1-phosphate transferase
MKFVWAYVVCFLVSFIATAAVMPIMARFVVRWGLIDDPGERKIHGRPTPLAGGLGIFTGLTIALVLGLVSGYLELADSLTGKGRFQIPVLFGGMTAMMVLGLVDDLVELDAARKFVCQLFIALAVAAAGIQITIFIPSKPLNYLITVLWILTIVNTFNFNDNMNGLCGGLGLIACLYFGIAAHLAGQHNVALIAFAVVGSIAGFIPYNFPKGRLFLGDSGSHVIGFLVAVLAITPIFYRQEWGHPLAVLKPVGVLIVPLVDLVVVVALRVKAGKPFYVGDTNHLSHQLVRRGLNHVQAVICLWIVAALGGMVVFL